MRDIAIVIEPAKTTDVGSLMSLCLGLSFREREVLQHVLSGRSTAYIADDLRISLHTVRDHVESIFAKTGAHRRSELSVVLEGVMSRRHRIED